jgi:membrane protein involved in colicin uptake
MNQAIAEGKRLSDIQKRKEEEARRKAELLEAQKQAEQAQIQATEAPKQEAGEIDAEAKKTEETAQNASMWINFSALLTVDQALKLKQFFNENNIQFKKI